MVEKLQRNEELSTFRKPYATSLMSWSCLRLMVPLVALAAIGSCTADDRPKDPALHVVERPVTRNSVPCEPTESSAARDETSVYRIRRGGSLRNVANLYKIHHHEVFALNPGIDPDMDLAPRTEVVLHRSNGERSQSIGLPHAGSIRHAVPLMDGAGRIVSAKRWKTWGTRATVRQLDDVLHQWAQKYPDAPPVLVGNLSSRNGGKLSPHKSHQSGRDVDLSYVLDWNGQTSVSWQQATASNLDAGRTWALLKLLVKSADIEVIFADRAVQRLLLEYAKKKGLVRRSRLGWWLEIAATEKRSSLVRHVPGHRDHFHVRFSCPSAETNCES